MTHKVHNVGVAEQIGRYSDAVETGPDLRWLYTSGTPGLCRTGALPRDISGQARIAWEHILEVLQAAEMRVEDLVKVTQYLTSPRDIAAYVKIRSEILGELRPAFMLLVVTELIRPDVLVEVEVIAARK